MSDHDLPLTIPVTDIVVGALQALKDADGLDRDEAYLLARLRNGEQLQLSHQTAHDPAHDDQKEP